MINGIVYDDIIRTIRSELIIQTGLVGLRILNATSVRGADLLKVLNEDEVAPFNLSDCFIIFEMLEDFDNDKINVVIPGDEKMNSIASFNFNLKIYGNSCHTMAQTILMRFKVADVVLKMLRNNIYITGIKSPQALNEFVNNTLWQRCDMSIDFTVKFEISKLGVEYTSDEFSEISNLIIKTID